MNINNIINNENHKKFKFYVLILFLILLLFYVFNFYFKSPSRHKIAQFYYPNNNGVEIDVNDYGLTNLSYNGVKFAGSENYNHIINNIIFETPEGTEKRYGWITGAIEDIFVSQAIRSFNSELKYFEHIYRNNLDNSFTVKMDWDIIDSKTAKLDIFLTNNDSDDKIKSVSFGYFLGPYFTVPNLAPGNDLLWGIDNVKSSPVIFVKGMDWGTVAFFTDDYSRNFEFSSSFGNPNQQQGVSTTFNFLFNFTNSSYPGGDSSNRKFDPINPGETYKFTLYIRFGSLNDTIENLASEAFEFYRQSHPFILDWPDRRPIGVWFIAEGSKRSQTNPRGYLWDPNIDISDIENFRSRILNKTDEIIDRMNNMNPKPQGIIIWDLEGQEFNHAFTYVGYPNKLPDIAPEMDSVADDMFSRFKSAGYKIGLTIRPQIFLTGTELPSTCSAGDGRIATQDVFIDIDGPFLGRNYYCTSPNTWQVTQFSPGFQKTLDKDEEILEILRSKVSYAYNRWGITLFYVDSNVYVNGGPINKNIFKVLQQEFPNVIFFPELESLSYFGVSAPYNEARAGIFFVLSKAKPMYPNQAFSFIQAIDGINHSDPSIYNLLKQSVKEGNILVIHPWYSNSQTNSILSIYRDAGLTNESGRINLFNRQPNVYAGEDINTDLFSVINLTGSASDPDGDILTYSWSKISGPGDVIFSNSESLTTQVSFSAPGNYIIRLSVSDGLSLVYDEIQIIVDSNQTISSGSGGGGGGSGSSGGGGGGSSFSSQTNIFSTTSQTSTIFSSQQQISPNLTITTTPTSTQTNLSLSKKPLNSFHIQIINKGIVPALITANNILNDIKKLNESAQKIILVELQKILIFISDLLNKIINSS